MNRRGFLKTLVAGATALALDPEKLLWTPGERTIFVPPVPQAITLQDWALRKPLDPALRHIVELLAQTNEILDDMIFREGAIDLELWNGTHVRMPARLQ